MRSRAALLALGLLLAAGCTADTTPGATATSSSPASSDPPSNDDVRPEAADWECEDTDAPFTQAEWMEYCSETVDRSEASGVGDTVDFMDDAGNYGRITLHGATRYTDPQPDEWDPEPTHPDGFLVVDVELVGVTGQVYVSPFFTLSLWDTAGHQYQAVTGVMNDGMLPDATLLPGRNARGVVVFDAPAGPLTLDYEGVTSSVPLVSFQVEV